MHRFLWLWLLVNRFNGTERLLRIFWEDVCFLIKRFKWRLFVLKNYSFGRSFAKDLPNPLKNFYNFATLLQNDGEGQGRCPAFEGLRELFKKKFPSLCAR